MLKDFGALDEAAGLASVYPADAGGLKVKGPGPLAAFPAYKSFCKAPNGLAFPPLLVDGILNPKPILGAPYPAGFPAACPGA